MNDNKAIPENLVVVREHVNLLEFFFCTLPNLRMNEVRLPNLYPAFCKHRL